MRLRQTKQTKKNKSTVASERASVARSFVDTPANADVAIDTVNCVLLAIGVVVIVVGIAVSMISKDRVGVCNFVVVARVLLDDIAVVVVVVVVVFGVQSKTV